MVEAVYYFVACLALAFLASFNFKRALEYYPGWEQWAYLIGGLICTGFATGYGVLFAVLVFERGTEWIR